MPTDKRALYQRMDVTERPAPTHSRARGYACAEMLLFGLLVACGLLFALALNAIIPPGW